MTNVKAIFVNLPIKSVQKTRKFWEALGFAFNEQFSDENALCMVLKEDTIYSMFITHEMFEGFSYRPVADTSQSQVLLAIEVESREKVDEIIRIALSNGGSRYRDSADHGWMYYDSFADPDGHQWEILYTDPTQIPTP